MSISDKIELVHHVYELYDRKDFDGYPVELGDWYLTGFRRWFHMIKAVTCIWLDTEGSERQYDEFWYDSVTMAMFGGSDRIIHPDLPSWAAAWTELKVPVGWRNWFYMIGDECNY